MTANTLSWDYCSAFITLHCNLDCSYCVQKQGEFSHPDLMPVGNWIEAFKEIPHNQDVPVTINGGEPTIYPGFYDIITADGGPFDLLTNGMFDVDEFLHRLKPSYFRRKMTDTQPGAWNASIRISYHTWLAAKKGDYSQSLIYKAKILKRAGYAVAFTCPEVPGHEDIVCEMERQCKDEGLLFLRKEFLGLLRGELHGTYKYPDGLDGKKRACECKTSELLISSDGHVYRCHRDLYASDGYIGHVLDDDFKHESKWRGCSNFGACNFCDLKLKANRRGEAGRCAVEIRA